MARLCRKHGLARGAEIGVADGRFAKGLLSAIPDLTLLGVDYWPAGYETWDGRPLGRERQAENRSAFFRVIEEFVPRLTLIEMPSLEAADLMPDRCFDFVFIDADHAYEAVLADICAWRPKVRPGGFMAGHDFDSLKFPGVVRAVAEMFPTFKTQEDYVWMAQIS
jgi:hypothetical protein